SSGHLRARLQPRLQSVLLLQRRLRVPVPAARKPSEDSDPRRRASAGRSAADQLVPLRAIVFDFDGVIANSEPLHFRAFQDVLARTGVVLTEKDYYTRYLGYDDVGVFTTVNADLGKGWSERERADMVADKALRLAELERDVSVIFPGAAEAIRRAAAALPIAIASGALGPEIRRALDREGLTKHFGATPLLPSECVAVEDSRWGLESARLAGLRTVGVTSAYDRSELEPFSDLVIGSISELSLEDLHRLVH